MGGGKEPPEFFMVVHVPHQKIFALQGFSWEAVRRLLKSDKVTEARCDQHNTKQEKSPDPVLAFLTTFFCKMPRERKN